MHKRVPDTVIDVFPFCSFAGFCFTETFDSISGKSRGKSFFGLNHTYLELWLAGHSSPLGAVLWPHPTLCALPSHGQPLVVSRLGPHQQALCGLKAALLSSSS